MAHPAELRRLSAPHAVSLRGVGPACVSLARTAAAMLGLPLLIAVLAPLAIGLSLLGVRPRSVHPLYVLFARAAMRVGGTRLEVRGAERVKPGAAYVVISNHESAWDPLCLLAALPGLVIRFVIKRAIMRIPLLGQALRATGNVLVVRTDTASDVRRIEEKMQRRDPQVSIMFFAEGTRARDGALHPFKKGPFTTALQHRLPLLPVAVAGTYRVWPKGTCRLRPGHVVVEIGEPISVAALATQDRDTLREQGFQAVRALRAAARAHLRERGTEPGGVE